MSNKRSFGTTGETTPLSDEVMRRKIREAIDDPRPDIDAEVVFDRIERRHAERMRREGKD
jgi:antitoxin ParD1/3/4